MPTDKEIIDRTEVAQFLAYNFLDCNIIDLPDKVPPLSSEITKGWVFECADSLIERIKSRLAAAKKVRASEWQPIETAPKDGTAIWIWVDGRAYLGYCEPKAWLRDHDTWFVKASWRDRGEDCTLSDEIFGCYGVDVNPTHWMPLPAAPDSND